MAVDLNWGLATQQPNILGLAQQGFAVGQAQGLQRRRDQAVQAYASNPEDTGALNALMGLDPQLGNQLVQGQLAARQEERQVAQDQAFRAAIRPDGTVDQNALGAAYLQGGDAKGYVEFQGQQRQAKKAELETQMRGLEVIGQLVAGVRDQGTYDAARAQAQQMGIDVSTLPPQFDPATVQRIQQQSLTVQQQLEQQWKALDANLNERKFGNTVQQQNIDNGFQAANLGIAQANLGLRAVEASNSAAGGMTPRQAAQTRIGLRKEFDSLSEVKAFKEIAPVLVSARKAPDTPAGDILLAYTVGKLLDPNSVVREGELAMVAKAGSPIERILGTTRFVAGEGGRLTPVQRNQLLGMLNERALANRQAYDAARANYEGYARESGVDPRSVVGTHIASAYAPRGAQPAKPPARAAGGWSIKPKGQ